MDKQLTDALSICKEKIAGPLFFSKEPIEFKQFEPKEINIITCENPTQHYKPEDFNTQRNTLTFKLSEKSARAIRRLFRQRVPRKLKKAIKKSCPGITPFEISHLASIAKIRRIKRARQ